MIKKFNIYKYMIKKYGEFTNQFINESNEDLSSICKEYGIRNWTLNSDGSIDVNGGVFISYKNLTKLPIKFGKVTGNFYCDYNQLTSLSGCPTSVVGDFNCSNNQLTSLSGSPTSVDGGFNCSYNQLRSLSGSTTSVGGDFYCHNNQLTTFEGICDSIRGNLYCSGNKIINFYGFPDRLVGIELNLIGNPLEEIYDIFKGDSRCIDLLNMTRSIYGDTVREMGIEDIADAMNFNLDEDWRDQLKSYKLVA